MARMDKPVGSEPNCPRNRTLEEQMVNGFLTIMTKWATCITCTQLLSYGNPCR